MTVITLWCDWDYEVDSKYSSFHFCCTQNTFDWRHWLWSHMLIHCNAALDSDCISTAQFTVKVFRTRICIAMSKLWTVNICDRSACRTSNVIWMQQNSNDVIFMDFFSASRPFLRKIPPNISLSLIDQT